MIREFTVPHLNRSTQVSVGLSVFVLFLAIFALTNNGYDTSEGSYQALHAMHIVRTGQLSFDELPVKDAIFNQGIDGRFYGSHEIGNVLFLLPTALLNVLLETILGAFGVDSGKIGVAQNFIFSFQSSIYCSVTAAVFFATLRNHFAKSIGWSLIATLCLVFTTYFLPHARNLFDGVVSMMLLTIAFFYLTRSTSSTKEQLDQVRSLCFAFFWLGLALISRLSLIFAIVASLLYVFQTTEGAFRLKMQRIGIALAVLMPFIVWQGYYNYIRTGLATMPAVRLPQYDSNNALDGNIFVGITGLLLSPGKSIFVFAPLLILAVVLFERFHRYYPKEAIYTAVLSVCWIVFHARLRSWYGAWGWGPRHFISILPILFLPIAVNLEYVWRSRKLRTIAIVLGLFGFVLTIASIISNPVIRIDYAIQNKLFADQHFVWNLWHSQPLDMLRGASQNLVRIVTRTPPPMTAKYYPEEVDRAANAINIWWLWGFIHLPRLVKLVSAALIGLIGFAALRNVLRQMFKEQNFAPSQK